MADDPDDDFQSKQDQDARRLKPPNKKKFEEDLEGITAQIRAIETELKSASVRGEEPVHVDARGIRAEINATIERRKKIDSELRMLNQSISKQMDKLTKIQSALHYRSEERINEAIRRLEYQMKTHNFKLSEEKKIVAEIDSLNRSKKSLVQYQTLKKEIDGMRDSQRRMRSERDHYYKAVTQLKSREDELRKRSSANHLRAVELKKELDSLYESKRMLTNHFRKIEKEYYEVRGEARKKIREESFKRREEEKKAYFEERQKEIDEYEATREPYEDEKLLCNTLITYLQRYLVSNDHDHHADQEHENQSHTLQQESWKQLEEKEGMFVLKKKKSEDDDLFGGVQRSKGKRSKRDKRKSSIMLHKSITHSPEIFSQFASLNLSAPATQVDVPASIGQLMARKEYYCSLPPLVKSAVLVELPDNESHTESSASMSESAICESIPSTPEVHHDNLPPAFPAVGELEVTVPQYPPLRKLSADSGTGELDDLGEERSLLLKLNIAGDTVDSPTVLSPFCDSELTTHIGSKKRLSKLSGCENTNQTDALLDLCRPPPPGPHPGACEHSGACEQGHRMQDGANAIREDNVSYHCEQNSNQVHDPTRQIQGCDLVDGNQNRSYAAAIRTIAHADLQLMAEDANQNIELPSGSSCSDRKLMSDFLATSDEGESIKTA